MTMQKRTLSTDGLDVSALGYGCMNLNSAYGCPEGSDECFVPRGNT